MTLSDYLAQTQAPESLNHLQTLADSWLAALKAAPALEKDSLVLVHVGLLTPAGPPRIEMRITRRVSRQHVITSSMLATNQIGVLARVHLRDAYANQPPLVEPNAHGLKFIPASSYSMEQLGSFIGVNFVDAYTDWLFQNNGVSRKASAQKALEFWSRGPVLGVV